MAKVYVPRLNISALPIPTTLPLEVSRSMPSGTSHGDVLSAVRTANLLSSGTARLATQHALLLALDERRDDTTDSTRIWFRS